MRPISKEIIRNKSENYPMDFVTYNEEISTLIKKRCLQPQTSRLWKFYAIVIKSVGDKTAQLAMFFNTICYTAECGLLNNMQSVQNFTTSREHCKSLQLLMDTCKSHSFEDKAHPEMCNFRHLTINDQQLE